MPCFPNEFKSLSNKDSNLVDLSTSNIPVMSSTTFQDQIEPPKKEEKLEDPEFHIHPLPANMTK
jgi:hypothetical protein